MSDDVLEISVDGKTIYLNAQSFISATWKHPAFAALRQACWKDGWETGTVREHERTKAAVEYYRELTYGINNFARERIHLRKEMIVSECAKTLASIEKRMQRATAREAMKSHMKTGDMDKNIKKNFAKHACAAYEPWCEEYPDHVEKEEIEEYLAGVR